MTWLVVGLVGLIALAASQAEARCKVVAHDWRPMIISQSTGVLKQRLLQIYAVEGAGCYVGDWGTSFGPFQFHHDGVENAFRRETGLDARDPKTVPAQIAFMRRWYRRNGNFSSNTWHGLRHGNRSRRYR